MKVLRFNDVIAPGFAAGKRIFIRADLNVPQDEAGSSTEDTRIRAAVEAGAAVPIPTDVVTAKAFKAGAQAGVKAHRPHKETRPWP